MIARFNLRAAGGYLLVVVYPDPAAMRVAGVRYNGGDLSQAAGCWTPAPRRFRYDAAGAEVETTHLPFAGVLRLAHPHVTTEVVVHELVHAAASIYRRLLAPAADLGDDCGAPEENFAYLVGGLAAQASTALADRDLWSDPCG